LAIKALTELQGEYEIQTGQKFSFRASESNGLGSVRYGKYVTVEKAA